MQTWFQILRKITINGENVGLKFTGAQEFSFVRSISDRASLSFWHTVPPKCCCSLKKEKNVGKEKSGKIFYKKLDQNIYQNLAQKMQPNLSTKLFNIKNLKKFVEIIF
jgi:hypothetical protein